MVSVTVAQQAPHLRETLKGHDCIEHTANHHHKADSNHEFCINNSESCINNSGFIPIATVLF